MYAFFKSHPMWLLVGAAAITIAALAVRVIVLQTTEKQLAENERLAIATVPLLKSIQEIDAFPDLMSDFFARKQVIETLARRSSPAAEVLAELSRLPPTIVFAHVRINELHLSASGNASTEGAVSEMITRLRTSRFIRSAQTRKLVAPREHGEFGPDAREFEVEMDLRP